MREQHSVMLGGETFVIRRSHYGSTASLSRVKPYAVVSIEHWTGREYAGVRTWYCSCNWGRIVCRRLLADLDGELERMNWWSKELEARL